MVHCGHGNKVKEGFPLIDVVLNFLVWIHRSNTG